MASGDDEVIRRLADEKRLIVEAANALRERAEVAERELTAFQAMPPYEGPGCVVDEFNTYIVRGKVLVELLNRLPPEP